MAKKPHTPRFTDSSWEATPDEEVVVTVAREQLVAASRMRSVADALEQRALTLAACVAQAQIDRAGLDSEYLFPVRSIAAELGAAMREPSGAIQRKMADASVLSARFPETTIALREARITSRHAAIIREHGERLPDGDVRDEFEVRAVIHAEQASPAQTRVFVKALADKLLPEPLIDRHSRARKGRGVWLRDLEDGLAELAVVGPAVTVHAAHDRLTAMGTALVQDERRQIREAAENDGGDTGVQGVQGVQRTGDAVVSAISESPASLPASAAELPEGRVPFGLMRDDDAFAPIHGRGSRGRCTTPQTARVRRDAFGQVIDENGYARHPSHATTAVATRPGERATTDERQDIVARDETGCEVASGLDADAARGASSACEGEAGPGSGFGGDTGRASGAGSDVGAGAGAGAETHAHTEHGPNARPDDERDEGADARTLDQARADLALDILLTGVPTPENVCDSTGANTLGAVRGTVHVTIPATSLIGIDDEPAFLAGYGPIDPDTARRLAGAASGWERLFRHPDTGVLLTVDRYQPTPEQRRFLAARDETCRFPCCRTPARRSDADHTVDRQYGGETRVDNLETLCRAHHMVKHHTPWTVKQKADGVLEWTSPLGTTYTDHPQPSARLRALADVGPPASMSTAPF